jgi:hypothetical protein
MLESTADAPKDNRAYEQLRQEVLLRFDGLTVDAISEKIFVSPSRKFSLQTSIWTGSDSRWDYSRGIVRRLDSQEIIADIKRNHALFWHSWVLQGDNEYLLCGEDYQGYNVIALNGVNCGRNMFTFPPEAVDGRGFCWTAVKASPDGKTLAVDGCYWACESELVLVDFSNPLQSPLPEKARHVHLKSLGNWIDNEQIEFTVYPPEDYE